MAITVAIENVGQAAAGGFDVAVFEDYTPLACGDPNGWDFSRMDGDLAPGASALVTFTHGGFGSAGMHTISAQTDSACEVFPENDEANNTLTQFVNVIDPNQPDLVVDSLMVPASVVVDQTYLVTATITNQGPVAADTFWGEIDLGIYVDHQPTVCEETADGNTTYFGAIAAGETVVISITMPGIPATGPHGLYAFMDWSCAVAESDEANNFFGPQALTVSSLLLAVGETALENPCRRYLDRGKFVQALPLLQRWLSLNSLREEVRRQLMQTYAWANQPNAALRQYRDCVRILDEELGVPPLPETTALYEAIQNDRLTGRQGNGEPFISPAPLLPLPPSAPLIGRETALRQMQQLYQQVGPDGRFLAITGEAGIGKTRLAEAFLAPLSAQGGRILSARGYAGEKTAAQEQIRQSAAIYGEISRKQDLWRAEIWQLMEW